MKTKSDKFGNEYAKLSEIKRGDTVYIDEGFDCMKPFSSRKINKDHSGLYIFCKGPNGEGKSKSCHHYLDGQAENLIGIYKIKPKIPKQN